jgi:hypothetical protein
MERHRENPVKENRIMRFDVFDDFTTVSGRGWMADNVAAELRAPLAAIGVRVVRHRGLEGNAKKGGFHARGSTAKIYRVKSDQVRDIVDRVLSLPAPQS